MTVIESIPDEPQEEEPMEETEFIDALKQSIVDAGFQVMPDDEFAKWQEENDEYWASSDGRSKEMLEEARLDYYLDNVAKHKFTSEMGEISGFGGGYEKTCRAMLDAGLQWFDNNPDADPKFNGMKGVYGIITEDNDDAQALSEAVVSVTDDASGAMHQAVVTSCLYIKKNGWDTYVEAMSKPDDD